MSPSRGHGLKRNQREVDVGGAAFHMGLGLLSDFLKDSNTFFGEKQCHLCAGRYKSQRIKGRFNKQYTQTFNCLS